MMAEARGNFMMLRNEAATKVGQPFRSCKLKAVAFTHKGVHIVRVSGSIYHVPFESRGTHKR